jgi:hypothetical protein
MILILNGYREIVAGRVMAVIRPPIGSAHLVVQPSGKIVIGVSGTWQARLLLP